MAGLISQFFPEFAETLPGRMLSTAGRGVQKIGTGAVDLASLPFTLTGMLKPEDAIGSTAWMDKKGAFIPEQRADGPYEKALMETIEMVPQLAAPTALGGMVGAGRKAAAPATVVSNPGLTGDAGIPVIRGQAANDVVMMNKASKLSADEKYAQRIADFARQQQEQAKHVVEGFAKAVGGKNTDAELGKRIQFNFETWFDNIQATYKQRTTEAYNRALNHPGATKPLPVSNQAWQDVVNFADKEMTENSPPALRAAITDLLARESVITNPNLTVREMRQHLEQANNEFSQNALKPGAYDTVNSGSLSRIQTVYKQALQKRLDEAVVNGPPDVAESASALKRADRLFGITIENQKNLQKQAINRFLGAREDEFLNPEQIANKFKSLSPTQRQFFTKVANKVDPEMIPVMRRHMFDDLYNAGIKKGANAGEAGFDMKQFLSKADDPKNKEMLEFVFEGAPDKREQFEGIIQNMREATNTGVPIATGNTGALANLAAGGVGLVTNQFGAARTAGAVFSGFENMFTDKEGLYRHLFEGGEPPKSMTTNAMGKVMDTTGRIATGAAAKTGVGAGFRQGVNMEAAEGLNSLLVEDAPAGPVQPQGGDIDPSLLEGWDMTQQTPPSPATAPPEGGVDPALLEGW